MSYAIKKYHGTYNRERRRQKVRWIVWHYVGSGTSAGGSARANCVYFSGGDRQASAHYFVDDASIYEYADPAQWVTWHCGTSGKYYSDCRNANSIGIEVCINGDKPYTSKEIDRLIWLTKKLMKQFDIPASHVIRHYDVTRKACPYYYTPAGSGGTKAFNALKAKLTESDEPTLLQCDPTGYWGTMVTKVWQALNGIDESGMILRQPESRKKYLKAFTSDNFTNHCIEFVKDSKVGEGSLAIKRLQNRKLGIPWARCTGVLDADTVARFIRKYCPGYEQTTTLCAPSTAVKNFAKEINAEAKKKDIKR